jgi:uncharacterized protein (TIGR03437 family)
MRLSRSTTNASLGILALAPVILYSYSTGVDPGYATAPGDNATGCMAVGCHTGAPNSGPGSVRIVASGGTTYVPGQTQTIAVTIADSSKLGYGFELSARVNGNPQQQGAGSLLAGKDGFTQVTACQSPGFTPYAGACLTPNASLQWITHTQAALAAASNTAPSFTYTFTWTPPAANAGTVTLYAAASAVNRDGTSNGDHNYAATLQLSPAAAGVGNAPAVSGAVSDATFAPAAASGAMVTAGSWVAIFGTNLAPAGDSRALNPATEIVDGTLPTTLDGTSVTVNGKPAFLGYISPTQVNIETPDDTAVGPVSVVVATASGASTPIALNLQKYAPGFFPSGHGNYLAAQHADSSPVGGYAGATPAKPGETIILWGTGFGPSSPIATPAGQVITAAPASPGNLAGITVTIGGVPAAISYAGITLSGLAQINVTVPAGLANGDAAVVASVGGVSSPASATIAVHD